MVLPLISACVTPQTKQVESLSPENKLFSDVQFTLSEQFKEKEIKCIAVGNLQITDENAGYPNLPKERLVRQAIIGNLTSKNYKALSLEELMKLCQSVIHKAFQPSRIVMLSLMEKSQPLEMIAF